MSKPDIKTKEPKTSERQIVKPTRITEDMIRLAKTDDLWHFANNLNAMLQYGYCSECGLVPAGCRREGCGANDDESE